MTNRIPKYDVDGDGSVDAGNVQHAPRDVLNVDEYGADDTGGTASDSAFSSAVSDATDGDIVLFKDGTYLLENVHVIQKSIRLKSVNATLNRTTGSTADAHTEDAMFTFRGGGTTGTSTALSADADEGDTVVSVTDASLFSVGDYVAVQSSGTYTVDADAETTFAEVTGVDTSNNDLTISEGCRFNHTTADSATVYQVEFLDRPVISGFDCEGDGANTSSWIRLDFCRRPVVEDVRVDGFIYQAISLFDCWLSSIIDCTIANAYQTGSSQGEAFQMWKSQDTYLRQPETVAPVRRGIDYTKQACGSTVVEPVIEASGVAGIATHAVAGGRDIEVLGGEVTDSGVNSSAILADDGCSIRVSNTTIRSDVRAMWNDNGQLYATDVEIHAGSGTSAQGTEVLLVRGGDTRVDMDVVQSSTSYFEGELVDIDAQNPIDRCEITIDSDIHGAGTNGFNIRTNGADIGKVDIAGTLRSQAATGAAVWVRPVSSGETIENVSLDGLTVTGHESWTVHFQGAGTVRNAKIRGCTIHNLNTTAPAIAVDDDSFDAFERLWVAENDLQSGGTNDVEVNEPDADRVWVVNNSAPNGVTVNSNATNTTVNGNN